MRVLFLNVPLHGHINPTLDLVTELVSSGNEIVYYASPSFCDKIEATGAEFRNYAYDEFKLRREITNIFNTAREMLIAAEHILQACRHHLNRLLLLLHLLSRTSRIP